MVGGDWENRSFKLLSVVSHIISFYDLLPQMVNCTNYMSTLIISSGRRYPLIGPSAYEYQVALKQR